MGKADAKERLCLHLIHRGITTLGARVYVMSAVHTEEDVDKTVTALVDSLVAMREEGSI